MLNYMCFDGGPFRANSYVLYDRKKSCVLIDPTDYDYFFQLVSFYGFELQAILLTHGHFDHIWGLTKVLERYNVPVYMHADDFSMLTDPDINFATQFGIDIPSRFTFSSPVAVKDKQVLKISELQIKVVHTPGHSKGSVCYITRGHLFSGDTLFKCSVGRTDGYGGSYDDLICSVNRLMKLPDNVKIHPGHGEESTIIFERENNPFIT